MSQQQLKRPLESPDAQPPAKQPKPLEPILAPARGRLVEHLDKTRPEVQQLFLKGYCIVRGVLSPEQVLAARNHIWDDSESLGTGIDRNNPATWSTKDAWPTSAHGLVQHGGWGLYRGVCAVRNMTEDAWKSLFKGEQPIASWDAMAICPPKFQHNIANTWRDKDVPEVPSWLHFDQANSNPELLNYVQGMLALYPAGQAEMSTILIAPRKGESAQSLRDRYIAAFPTDPTNKKHMDAEKRSWMQFSAEQKRWFVRNANVRKPRLEAGDMLLWASGVAHASGPDELPPGQTERGLRVSLMISCVPRCLVGKEEILFRQELLQKGRTSGHRVCVPKVRGKGFAQCLFGRKRQAWGGDQPPVFNTERLLSDFGTRRPDDEIHSATARFCGGYSDA